MAYIKNIFTNCIVRNYYFHSPSNQALSVYPATSAPALPAPGFGRNHAKNVAAKKRKREKLNEEKRRITELQARIEAVQKEKKDLLALIEALQKQLKEQLALNEALKKKKKELLARIEAHQKKAEESEGQVKGEKRKGYQQEQEQEQHSVPSSSSLQSSDEDKLKKRRLG